MIALIGVRSSCELLRLPLEALVLCLEVARGRAHAGFEFVGERFDFAVEPLVLDLFGKVVQHRDDGHRLTAVVADLARNDFHRQQRAVLRPHQRHALVAVALGRQRELSHEGGELGVVA
jgi:hypothetical protein